MNDAIIENKSDELYNLQSKYNVKISRSNSSDAVYIYRRQSYRVRVGHPISSFQKHIRNFAKNYVTNNVTKELVEKVIQKEFS